MRRDDIATAWVEELRKPGLRQTQFAMRRRDGECCIGVLARVIHEQFPEVEKASGDYIVVESDRTICHVPEFEHMVVVSLSHGIMTGIGMTYNEMMHYVYLNDTRNWPFPRIADEIVKNQARLATPTVVKEGS